MTIWQYVVDLKTYKGTVHALLVNGVCAQNNKTAEDFKAEGYTILNDAAYFALEDEYCNSICGKWSEVTEEEYKDALNCLPPLRFTGGCFFIAEATHGDVHSFYCKHSGSYYTSLQRLSYKTEDILAELEKYLQTHTQANHTNYFKENESCI